MRRCVCLCACVRCLCSWLCVCVQWVVEFKGFLCDNASSLKQSGIVDLSDVRMLHNPAGDGEEEEGAPGQEVTPARLEPTPTFTSPTPSRVEK